MVVWCDVVSMSTVSVYSKSKPCLFYQNMHSQDVGCQGIAVHVGYLSSNTREKRSSLGDSHARLRLRRRRVKPRGANERNFGSSADCQ